MLEMQSTTPDRLEPRWPSALTILFLLLLLESLPGRIRFFPDWFPIVVALVVIAPMAGIWITRGYPLWLRIERFTIYAFCLLVGIAAIKGLANLIDAMIHRSTEVTGLQLLTSAISIWVTNAFGFALLYWRIDRGGPERRANDRGPRPDFLFPQSGVPDDAPVGWRPTFIDYLALGYSTAAAFSPTDALPLTTRAKLLMMLQSVISLVTIVVVASRAINILGS